MLYKNVHLLADYKDDIQERHYRGWQQNKRLPHKHSYQDSRLRYFFPLRQKYTNVPPYWS